MKICLYFPVKDAINGNGIGSALKHQMKAMDIENIEYTYSINDDYDILHINFPDPLSLYAIEKAKSQNKKIVIHTHTTAEDFKNSFILSGVVKPILKQYLKKFYNSADLILCPSNYTKDLLIKKYNIKKPIEVISNGVEIEKFDSKILEEKREIYREKYNLNGTVVFSVGIVVNRKGVRTFLNVAKNFRKQNYKNVSFVWYGTIYHSLAPVTYTEVLIKKMLIRKNNVTFTGYVDDITNAYSSGDIFLFPTKEENQGISLLEAIASKKPTIIRDLPVFDWLQDGKDCLKAKDDNEFYEKTKILVDDENLRTKIRENAYNKLISEGHSLKDVAKRLKKIYENLLSGYYSWVILVSLIFVSLVKNSISP